MQINRKNLHIASRGQTLVCFEGEQISFYNPDIHCELIWATFSSQVHRSQFRFLSLVRQRKEWIPARSSVSDAVKINLLTVRKSLHEVDMVKLLAE